MTRADTDKDGAPSEVAAEGRSRLPGDVAAACRDVLGGSPVLAAWLFGSHAAGGATGASDVDVALARGEDPSPPDHDPGLAAEVAYDLTRRLGREADVVVLDDSPLWLVGRVLTGGRLVYDPRPPERAGWESLMLRMFADFDVHDRRFVAASIRRMADA